MTTPPTPPPAGAQPQPKFDLNASHHNRPKLRPVRGFPLQAQGPDGKQMVMLGLSDARQISEKMVVTMPAVQIVLPKMDGTRDIDQIVAEVGQGLTRPVLEGLVAQLDDAGLIEGPVFQKLLDKVRADFDSSPVLPPATTAAFADAVVAQAVQGEPTEQQKTDMAPAEVGKVFDEYMKAALKDAEKPSFDELPRAVVVPHLDYPRGWMNYGAVYGRMRVVDRPDRIVILGTNHFGQSTGVCGCDKGYQTPMGTCEVDPGMLGEMRKRLGDKLFEHRFDHEREHSVELQIMWIQHVFGKDAQGNYPAVFGALVHDPAVNNGESYDGKGISLQAFVDALKASIEVLPGKTLIISSADLSHVGPAFGDRQAMAGDDPNIEAFRNQVIKHDQEMLTLVKGNKPSELVAAMAWQQNPTRWCSTGNLCATLMTVEPAEIELLNYGGAMDQAGSALVTSVAMAMR